MKIKMKKIIVIFLLFFIKNSYSQKTDGICDNSNYFGVSISQIEYIRFSKTIIKDRYSSFKEVLNNTQEELLKSMLSAKDNKWVSFNYGQEMYWTNEQFERLRGPNKYIDLLCKINITVNNESYSIVKLNLFEGDKKPQYLSLVLKKLKNRWIISSDDTLSNLNFLIMFTSMDDIDSVFNNSSTNNDKLNNIIRSSWNKNLLDLSKIISELGKMMLNQEYLSEPIINTKNISINKIKVIPVIYNYPLLGQKLCRYFPNEISKYEELDLNLILTFIKSKQIENSIVKPLQKLTYLRNNELISILKYSIKSSSNNELKTEQFVINKNIVSLANSIKDDVNDRLFDVIKRINSESLIQFSNRENNPKYPEINKLKPLVKDADGVLDVFKLAEVIEKNKSTLSQYLDE